ncbi:SgcJ/EcaC family oxidoreductase [Nocardia huaxiensis]|uniref:SgcJ/EcaC family oxidoreductase n=1 Tax=Nocardia huaxiensis TaxID=2755382 RepID=UPI001E50B783|nr:SgcJ/EcaC family oxidoreductase [Nocardia huaxiensis]UFS98426.1 SgcJ/EcaC family oxidoreductase [Nocardia huaxiensis]
MRTVYAELLDAWNRRSAGDFASRFADDALLVTVDGNRVPGASLTRYCQLVFVDHPETRCVGHVFSIRQIGSNAVLLHAIAGIVPAGRTRINPAVNAVHTLLAEKRAGTWQIVLFQHTPADYHGRPELADQHTTRLQQIVDADHS